MKLHIITNLTRLQMTIFFVILFVTINDRDLGAKIEIFNWRILNKIRRTIKQLCRID